MIRGLNQPSQYIEDWKLPKTTPKTTLREIEEQCGKGRIQLVEWIVEIRKIIELIDPHNKPLNADERLQDKPPAG